MEKKTIFIVSGPRGSGKTMFTNEVYEFLAVFENNVRGFISRGKFNEEGQKDFILEVLGEKKKIHLASRKPSRRYIKAGDFFFNPRAIKKGEKIIRSAIEKKSPVLIIDEIGPLELNEEIWHNSFQEALDTFEGILIFTCRRKMVDKVIEKYKITEAFVQEVQKTSARKTGEAVMSILLKLKKNKLVK